MDRIRSHVQNLMKRLQFPEDAQAELLDAFDTILKAPESEAFTELLRQYDANMHCDYKEMLAKAAQVAEVCHIHAYTVSLLLFLCMSRTLLRRYRSRGIEDSIYYRSMADLRYKLEECRLVYGINGSFVASWFGGFFNLTRFGLGRLQFEIKQTTEDFMVEGILVPAGSNAINVHIPRTGTKLCHEEVLAAYQMASRMFAEVFEGKRILFICKSWLLDPWNQAVLKPDSNLAKFCNDFEIVKAGEYEGYGELWRLFDCRYTGDAEKLPRDSSLRRAYADRVARGEPIGWGLGMFAYDKTFLSGQHETVL